MSSPVEQLIVSLQADPALAARFRAAPDTEAFAALVAETGLEVSWADVAPYVEVASSELSDDELDGVAGGVTLAVTVATTINATVAVSVAQCDEW